MNVKWNAEMQAMRKSPTSIDLKGSETRLR
jgi:hypothetical protein